MSFFHRKKNFLKLINPRTCNSKGNNIRIYKKIQIVEFITAVFYTNFVLCSICLHVTVPQNKSFHIYVTIVRALLRNINVSSHVRLYYQKLKMFC